MEKFLSSIWTHIYQSLCFYTHFISSDSALFQIAPQTITELLPCFSVGSNLLILDHRVSSPNFGHSHKMLQIWTHHDIWYPKILAVTPLPHWPNLFYTWYWLVKEVASLLLLCNSYQVCRGTDSWLWDLCQLVLHHTSLKKQWVLSDDHGRPRLGNVDSYRSLRNCEIAQLIVECGSPCFYA